MSVDDSPDAASEQLTSKLEETKSSFLRRIARIIREENSELLEEHLAMKPLLSVDDLANTLGVSKRTVETIIAEDELRPIWVRGQRRFHPDAVNAYLRRRSQEK
jgi:excisionase family DNA binding protein